MRLVLIGVGGAAGAIARYILGGVVHQWIPGFFPYGTFVVNILGCLVFGLIVGLAESRFVVGPEARAFLLVGVLGGFTTFSSFTFETFELVRSGQVVAAGVNVIGQVVIGFLLFWAGFAVGRV
ncbi:MAG TPA: fluoride efflux transporter CrcB [Vicinamibacterales bacterium]|nr:fluoride efflux transporter CrcB [Vicinamibacterales bacterium]